MVAVTPASGNAYWLDKTEMTAGKYAAALGKSAPADAERGLPVRNVTWEEASAACKALGKRLPTESEWEAAATQHALDPKKARLRAAGVKGPAPVGTYPGDCTPDGVCDLIGNVSEWMADPWQPDDSENRRVIRGGSFGVAPTSQYAKPESRTKVKADARDPELGFRCARDADQ
jgi:formylglycine-generating enzyme required for sulfatase activity